MKPVDHLALVVFRMDCVDHDGRYLAGKENDPPACRYCGAMIELDTYSYEPCITPIYRGHAEGCAWLVARAVLGDSVRVVDS